ncbi:hypothetical protein, partial [Aquimarina sp. Aq78]|uniref:hypothetical protein n=1 Tax=Aquimarina sp. Aq78 TaxID=1191889 RepID=UPI001F2D96B5
MKILKPVKLVNTNPVNPPMIAKSVMKIPKNPIHFGNLSSINIPLDYIFIIACCIAILVYSVIVLIEDKFPKWIGF